VIVNVLLIVVVGVPLVLIAAQGVVVLARLFGLSPSEVSTREEFSRITFEGSQAETSSALAAAAPEIEVDAPAPGPAAAEPPGPAEVPLEWRSCPTCGEAVTTHARMCRHCGDALPRSGQASLAISRDA
jgi:hypothetical protein